MSIIKQNKKNKKTNKFSDNLLDDLLENYQNPDDLMGNEGILQQLTGALISRAMEAELDSTIGYKKHANRLENSNNYRNGTSKKTVKTGHGEVKISVPRDRNNEYDPIIIEKNQTHFDGFDKQIISMYSRGMTNQDIANHIEEIYSTKVSKDFITTYALH